MRQRLDLLKQYGPEAVTQAIDEVASFVGFVDEIGSSDISAWVKDVERHLSGSGQVNELSATTHKNYQTKADVEISKHSRTGDKDKMAKRSMGFARSLDRLPMQVKTRMASMRQEGKTTMKKTEIVLEGVKFRVEPSLAKVLRRFPHEVQNFDAGAEMSDHLYDALYDHYCANGEMPYGTMKARDGDPYEWIANKLDKELHNHHQAEMTEGADSTIDPELERIIDKYPHEMKVFKETGELDDGELYEELFDHYSDNGEMPYGVAKARTGDPVQWISDRLDKDLGVPGNYDEAPDESDFMSGPGQFDDDGVMPEGMGGDIMPMEGEIDEALTGAQQDRLATMRNKDAEWAKVKAQIDAGGKGTLSPFRNEIPKIDTKRHSELDWRSQHGIDFHEDDESAEMECPYCGKEVPSGVEPSMFNCCGEVGHAQPRSSVDEDSVDPTPGNDDSVLTEDNADIVAEILINVGLDEGLDFFFDQGLVVIGRSTARVALNALKADPRITYTPAIESVDGEEVRIVGKKQARPVADRNDVNDLATEPDYDPEIDDEPVFHESKQPVKEEVSMNITARGDDDVLNIIRKLSGLGAETSGPGSAQSTMTDMPAMLAMVGGHSEEEQPESGEVIDVESPGDIEAGGEGSEHQPVEEVEEDTYANEPAPKVLPGYGTARGDKDRQGRRAPLTAPGNNPMAEARSLMRQYESMLAKVKTK
jgi:hypothetical protein